LTSFVSTQKHQVAEKLRRKFETKYITAITAHNELLHFLLKKLIKKKMDIHLLSVAGTSIMEDEVAEDDSGSTRPTVTIPELKAEAIKMDIPSIEEYLESDLFLDAFEIENGNIMKRNDFDGALVGADMEM